MTDASEILTLRTRLGLTRGALALALDVHARTIARWEAGTSTVHYIYLERMRSMVDAKEVADGELTSQLDC